MITVIGLGNKDGDITLRGAKAIEKAKKVFLKTAKTPTYNYFAEKNIEVFALDDFYETAENFEDLDLKIAQYICDNSSGSSVFCVNGGGYEDTTVALLSQMTKVEVIEGVSKASAVGTSSFLDERYAVSATKFLERSVNYFNPSVTTIIFEMDNKELASEVKLKLLNYYTPETKVSYLVDKKIVSIDLEDLDRQKKYNYSSSVMIVATNFVNRSRYSFGDLVEIIRRLRDKDGCKWDREQTHLSIRQNAIEEAYELVEAIELDDIDKMQEESGDVLLQALFHSIIAEDNGEFTTEDMISALCYKLISRHTHIFGENKASSTEEALMFWEKAKAVEKGYKGLKDKLDSIPTTFNSVMKAEKIQKIAKKNGFDFNNAEEAIEKLLEELSELRNASPSEKEMEGGDLIFSCINVLRLMGIDSELALNQSTNKFLKRLLAVDEQVTQKGKNMKELTMEELDIIYNGIKKEGK